MMQVSRKVDYALRAVIYLSLQEGGRPAPVSEIAARRRIPKKFLEKIIKDLIRADIVASHRGAHGGYTLTRPGDRISFRSVIEAIEGPIALNVCGSEQHDCSVLSSCNMQKIWLEGQRRVLEYFEGTSIADLVPSFTLSNPSNSVAQAAV